MILPSQFTLRSLFVATAFIAVACASAKYCVSTGDLNQPGPVIAADIIVIGVCGAIGALRGRLWAWLAIGLAIDVFFLLMGLLLPGLE
jgi:hydrogenase/urease accessory protein HupE